MVQKSENWLIFGNFENPDFWKSEIAHKSWLRAYIPFEVVFGH